VHELGLERAGRRIARGVSKSATPSNTPEARNELVERLALLVLLGESMGGVGAPSAGVSVAPITRTPGMRARMRSTPSFIPAWTASTVALPLRLKSLIPSSRYGRYSRERQNVPLEARAGRGAAGEGFCGE